MSRRQISIRSFDLILYYIITSAGTLNGKQKSTVVTNPSIQITEVCNSNDDKIEENEGSPGMSLKKKLPNNNMICDKSDESNKELDVNTKHEVQIQQNKTVDEQVYRNHAEEVIMNKQIENLQSNEGNWKKVVYKNKKQYSTKQRSQPIKGEVETTSLLAAKQLSCLFLTGLKPKTKPEKVKNQINETFNIDETCEAMKTKKEIYKRSFKLYVPLESKETLMDSSKWGKGISINHFIHLRRYLNREK